MDTMLNPQNQDQPVPLESASEKSELMQIFESHVNDMYWGYRDLLKAIFESDEARPEAG
jgi:hypothetical protein